MAARVRPEAERYVAEGRVRHGDKFRPHSRLVLKNVKPSSEDGSTLQRLDKRPLANYAPRETLMSTPSGPSTARSALPTRCLVSAPLGTITIRTSDALAKPTKLWVIVEAYSGPAGATLLRDRHAEALHSSRNGLADVTKSKDADTPAPQRRRKREAAMQPLAIAHVALGLRNMAESREEETHGQVGNLVVQHPGVWVTTIPARPLRRHRRSHIRHRSWR
jgi:hypothetical protein